MDYIGTVLDKLNYDGSLYTDIARWCNETQKAKIIDNGNYYKVVAIPELTFEELKAAKLASLETEYDNHVSGSFTTSQGYLMQFDTSDSLKMQGAITLMEAIGSSTGYLTQANDVTVYNIPIETMKAVLVEMLSAYAQCHARKQELRTFINNAQTKEELDEIVISWPV